MTGPGEPFEGRNGLRQHLGVEAPKWEGFGGGAKPFRITGTSVKAYPSVIHTQGPIGQVLELRQQVATAEIDSVHVATYGEAVRRTATEAEKWNPETRETADHSIPYLVAAAFQDGDVTPATCAVSDPGPGAAPADQEADGGGGAGVHPSLPRGVMHADRGDDDGRTADGGGDEPSEGALSQPANGRGG